MKRISIFLALLVPPSVALAVDFTDVSSRYTDAPFNKSEAAGISVLTNIGSVKGNPDGSFAAERTLNRAEFLKIAYESNVSVSVSEDDAADCFPDVKEGDWFSRYVCLAKERGDVEGYPDGFFRPANSVNYAEGLKILVELFGYTLPEPGENERWAWYTGYLRAAQEHKVALSLPMDHLLTRGEMARLTAAFVAEDAGQLAEYRLFEQGKTASSASSISSASSTGSSVASETSSSSSSSVSSSSSAATAAVTFPAVSRFVLAGQMSYPLIDGLFTAPEEDLIITGVDVELYREIHSLDALELVDASGKVILTLKLKSLSNTGKTKWDVDISTGSYKLPQGAPVRLGLRARTKAIGNGGVSNELIEFKTWTLSTQGATNSRVLAGTDTHMPLHQTSYGRVTGMKNTLATSLSVQQGATRQLGTFQLTGQSASGGILQIDSLVFEIQASDVAFTNIRIGGSPSLQQTDCSIERAERNIVTCPIPEALRTVSINPISLSIFADLTVAAAKTSGNVQLKAEGTGKIGQNGSIRWNDGSTTFHWVEEGTPTESGPMVTVTK